MRWRRGERSESLEDRRAEGGRRLGAPSIGIGGLLLLLAASYFFGQDLLTPVLEQTQTTSIPAEVPPGGAPPETSPEEEERVDFVSFVIDDLQATWTKLLPGYRPAKLVLFRGAIQSGCGYAQAAMGPFYCPLDEKVYIDLAFYEALHRRFGAPGDFAQAYVIAHEVGHHVQKLLGIEQEVRRAQRARPNAANVLSVRMELQADCLAGVWGHWTARRDILESYVKRLEKLEGIADSFKGVSKSFALQAGREIRIMVESEKISDEEAIWLSKDIARRIENELEYPGQIKVTVIRETRAVEFAR
jgi:predicted metalloprotease